LRKWQKLSAPSTVIAVCGARGSDAGESAAARPGVGGVVKAVQLSSRD